MDDFQYKFWRQSLTQDNQSFLKQWGKSTMYNYIYDDNEVFTTKMSNPKYAFSKFDVTRTEKG